MNELFFSNKQEQPPQDPESLELIEQMMKLSKDSLKMLLGQLVSEKSDI